MCHNQGAVRAKPTAEKVAKARFHAASVYFQRKRARFANSACPNTIMRPYKTQAVRGTIGWRIIQSRTGTGS
jgi:hypothetical protein